MSSSDHRGRKTAATKRDAVVKRVVARRASHHRSCDGAGFGGCGQPGGSGPHLTNPQHDPPNLSTPRRARHRRPHPLARAGARSHPHLHRECAWGALGDACGAVRRRRVFCAAVARFALFACGARTAACGACSRWSLGGTRHPRALAQMSSPLSDLTSTSAFLTREIKL